MRSCRIRIEWHKVDSHTGDRWNERADELAKKGASSLNLEPIQNEETDLELQTIAEEFADFLKDRGYQAALRGIYGNSDNAKIEISKNDKSIGYVNIYCTKKIPFLPRYHELKDKLYEHELDSLWQEYHYGERQLPFS